MNSAVPKARRIRLCRPLKRTDCSLVSDGAAALVLTDAETAKTMGKAVNIKATAHAQDFLPMSKRDILLFEGCTVAWQRALQSAGVQLSDLSLSKPTTASPSPN